MGGGVGVAGLRRRTFLGRRSVASIAFPLPFPAPSILNGRRLARKRKIEVGLLPVMVKLFKYMGNIYMVQKHKTLNMRSSWSPFLISLLTILHVLLNKL